MSSTADIADAASAVQTSLTEAEAELLGRFGELPPWYLALRGEIHGLVTASGWAVSEGGLSIMGFRCHDDDPHLPTCLAYRAAHAAVTGEDAAFPVCSECGQTVHEVQPPRGVCDTCAWRTA